MPKRGRKGDPQPPGRGPPAPTGEALPQATRPVPPRPAKAPPPPRRKVNDDGDDPEEEEEEPEGEDLFAEGYLQDYINAEEEAPEDDVVSSADSFLDSGSYSDASDGGGKAAVDDLLEQRHRVEAAISMRAARRARAAELLSQGVAAGAGGDGSSSSSEESEEAGESSPEAFSETDEAGQADANRPSPSRRRRRDARRGDAARQSTAAHPITDTAASAAAAAGPPQHEAYFEGDVPSSGFDWTKPTGGSVLEWLHQDAPRRIVKNRIYNFLYNYVDPAEPRRYVFRERVFQMTVANGCSLEVNFMQLASVHGATLALWLVDCPETMLSLLTEAANFLVYRALVPHYTTVHPRVHVRITDLPYKETIRGFRQTHRNILVRVEGVVVRRSPVYPQLKTVRYDCLKCSFVIGPVVQRNDREMKVTKCPSCHSTGPFRVNMAFTEYRNHQTLVLQEPPGTVLPGRLPRSLEVILTDDLIDRVKPGELVEVTGIYANQFDPMLNHRQGFPVFTTNLVANNLQRRSVVNRGGLDSGNTGGGDAIGRSWLVDEADKIRALSRHPKIKQKLAASMAPSIHGHPDIKLGLLLVLLGGVGKDIRGDKSHTIRGDINCLLVGDPGCAKSQFLKFLEKTAERAIFTTGRGTTAVGLTAAVHRDPVTGDFALEGGAMVMADQGVCLIDEFDKMSDQDRTSIHEAMEQQTISVARGGIVTSLSARCSVVAAANPIGGRYDPSQSFDANVDLTTPILSRFDLLFVVRDEVNPEVDQQLAQFICASHQRSHPSKRAQRKQLQHTYESSLLQLQANLEVATTREQVDEAERQLRSLHAEFASLDKTTLREDEDPSTTNPLQQRLLRRYISYAKSQCRPQITHIDDTRIVKLYTDLRQESRHGGVPITVRHLESVIRLSEAHAKLHLRDFVTDDDVSCASALFLRCFMASQKYSQRSALERKFRRYLESDIEPMQLLHYRLKALVRQQRAVMRQMSYGVEPVTVTIDAADFDAATTSVNVSRDAANKYFESTLFTDEFELVCDAGQRPTHILHTIRDR